MNTKLKYIIVLVLTCILTATVTATMVANYLILTHIMITGAPGITVLDINNQPLTVIEWGDIQRGMSKSIQIKVKNSQDTIAKTSTQTPANTPLGLKIPEKHSNIPLFRYTYGFDWLFIWDIDMCKIALFLS